jgi:hypothetical protein
MGPIGCAEKLVRNYHYSLRNKPEERISRCSDYMYFTCCTILVRILTETGVAFLPQNVHIGFHSMDTGVPSWAQSGRSVDATAHLYRTPKLSTSRSELYPSYLPPWKWQRQLYHPHLFLTTETIVHYQSVQPMIPKMTSRMFLVHWTNGLCVPVEN